MFEGGRKGETLSVSGGALSLAAVGPLALSVVSVGLQASAQGWQQLPGLWGMPPFTPSSQHFHYLCDQSLN